MAPGATPGSPSDNPDDDGEPVPRLPRGRGVRLSRPELLRVAVLAILLVFLLATYQRCASAVSSFVTSFGDQGSAARAMPRPDNVDVPGSAAGSGSGLEGYERLRPGMTDAEVKAAIERARARAAGSGSAARQAAEPPTSLGEPGVPRRGEPL